MPGALGQLDPNIEWNEAENFVYADQSPYVGIDNLVNDLFMRLMTSGGLRGHPEQFIASGDRVAVLGRYSGTYRETGKPMNAQMVHVFKVANGKIVHFSSTRTSPSSTTSRSDDQPDPRSHAPRYNSRGPRAGERLYQQRTCPKSWSISRPNS